MPKRPRPKLTDRFVESIREPGIFRDGPGGIPGLLIRAGKTARTWELRSERPPRFTKTLGRADDAFHPMQEAEARAKAHELLSRHRRGLPLDEPTVESMTVEEGFEKYLADLERRGKSENTIIAVGYSRDRLEDKVRAKTLRALSEDPRIAVAECERITDEVGGPSAMTTMMHLRSVYRYVRKRHDATLPERSPTVDVVIKPIEPQNVPVLLPHELPAWNAKRLKIKNDVRREAWLYGLLSGLRRDNLYGLKWSMLDRKRGVMRMTQKGNKPLLLVLSGPMLECLDRAKEAGERLHRENAKTYVFPSRTGHIIGLEKDGLGGGAHMLRRSYGSLGRNARVSSEDVDRLLGHTKHQDRPMLKPYDVDEARIEYFREQQETISAHILALLEGRAD